MAGKEKGPGRWCVNTYRAFEETETVYMTQADLLMHDARTRASTVLVTGEKRKAAGQALVLENESNEWLERFTFLAKCYIASLPEGALFAVEDIRAYCDTCGLPKPHSPNVWGPIPRRLIKAGLPMVNANRTRKASTPETKAHPVSLYRKTGGAA